MKSSQAARVGTLRILADENMPAVEQAFGALGTVRTLPGRAIGPDDLRDVDVLLVRSVTKVDAALLRGTPVRFVGSATIGTDHVDEAALREAGIAFAHAPGSNAESVVEYVLAALLHLAATHGTALRGKTLGIVGCGNIGGHLARRAPALGMRLLQVDPPLADRARREGRAHDFVDLETALARADVVTLHVPLTREGPHATYHLIDEAALRRMKPGAWLLNTCRGAVISNPALRRAMAEGRPGAVVLDVWEHEPTPDPALIEAVDLGTPHIAGYSYDGKVWGTIMLYHALTAHFGLPRPWDEEAILQAGPEDRLHLALPPPSTDEVAWLGALVRQMYDIAADDRRLRALPALPPEQHAAFFSDLRRTYPRRRAFSRHRLPEVPAAYREAVEAGLCVRVG